MPEPEAEKFNEYMKSLDTIRERMMKAGLIKSYGHVDATHEISTDFTEFGKSFCAAVCMVDQKIGPLNPNEIVILWEYLVGSGKPFNPIAKF